jgi:two-component system sensor histidine kinase VicK
MPSKRGYRIPKPLISLEREGIAQFFGLSLILYALVVVAVLLVAFTRYEQFDQEKRIHRDGFTLVNLVTAFARSNLESEKRLDLYHVLDIAKREKGILYCLITDTEGNPFIRIGRELSDNSEAERIATNAIHSDRPLKQVYEDPSQKNAIYEFSKPVFVGGMKRAVVRLGLTHDANTILPGVDGSLSLALLIILPLAALFYYLFRRFLRPLRVFEGKLDETISGGQFQELAVKAKGEVATLARQVNRLISLFNKKYRAAESAKDELKLSINIKEYEKNKIEGILDQIDDGVLATNSAGEIIYVNKRTENLFGVSRQELVGKTVEESIQNETLLSFVRAMKENAQGLGPKRQPVLTDPIDGKGTFRLVYSPVKNPSGDGIGDLMVIKDVTNQAMAEQARSEFLSHAAHEMRSPLHTIKAYGEMLMDGDVKDQEQQKEFYNVITMETERLGDLIEDLLNISKIEMGSLTIRKEMVKPINLVEGCIAAVMSQAVHKNVEIKKALPDSLSPLDIDKGLVEVALLNSMSNSVKYTPQGGMVTISAEENPDYTSFSIRDTGVGIRDEDLPHIFDKFYRSPDEAIQRERGSGLGLSLSKEIVSLHGGEIKVESATGQGSCFTFILPRETDFERMF